MVFCRIFNANAIRHVVKFVFHFVSLGFPHQPHKGADVKDLRLFGAKAGRDAITTARIVANAAAVAVDTADVGATAGVRL